MASDLGQGSELKDAPAPQPDAGLPRLPAGANENKLTFSGGM